MSPSNTYDINGIVIEIDSFSLVVERRASVSREAMTRFLGAVESFSVEPLMGVTERLTMDDLQFGHLVFVSAGRGRPWRHSE